MAHISFYHTNGETPAALDAILPPLLEKALAAGTQALVICPSESRAQRLDETLWTFSPPSFLPHATAQTPSTLQPFNPSPLSSSPVLLTHAEAESPLILQSFNPSPSSSRLPIILAGAESALEPLLQPLNPSTLHPAKILYVFSAAQADVARARPLYKKLKEGGHAVQYFQQTPKGWQKK